MKEYDHTCPDCGGSMVLRKNRKTDTQFWGCASYPACTGTRTADGVGKDDAAPDEMPSDRFHRNDSRRWRNE